MTARLPENLDLIATTPDGIRKLRGLILELAVRGKLVPQDPDDEPASELLKRVGAECRQLKLPPRPPADDFPDPFSLPDGWQWTSFGDVAQHNSGKTLDKGRNTGHTRRYITTSNLYWGRFDLANVREMPIRDEELERCTARRNDLLICEGGEAGRAAVWDADEEICFQNHVHRARFFAGINPHYGYRIFQRLDLSGEINQFRKGVGISNLSGKALASIPFPLPPVAEQHRIVAKVDELMALLDRLEGEQADAEAAHTRLVDTLLGTLTQSTDAADLAVNWQRFAEHFDTLFTTESSVNALKQTILQLAVMGKLVPQDPDDEPASELLKRIARERAQLETAGKIKKAKPIWPVGDDERLFEIPAGWRWARFSQIATVNGRLVDSQRYPDATQVAPDSIEKGTGRLIERRTVRDAGVRGPNQQFRAGQLLYSKIRPSLAKAVIVDFDGLCSADMYPLDPYIEPRFLLNQILSDVFLVQARIAENRVKMPKLNQESLNMFLVCIPPLAEQHRIVAKVDELIALCDRLKADLAESRSRQQRLAATLIESALAAG